MGVGVVLLLGVGVGAGVCGVGGVLPPELSADLLMITDGSAERVHSSTLLLVVGLAKRCSDG